MVVVVGLMVVLVVGVVSFMQLCKQQWFYQCLKSWYCSGWILKKNLFYHASVSCFSSAWSGTGLPGYLAPASYHLFSPLCQAMPPLCLPFLANSKGKRWLQPGARLQACYWHFKHCRNCCFLQLGSKNCFQQMLAHTKFSVAYGDQASDSKQNCNDDEAESFNLREYCSIPFLPHPSQKWCACNAVSGNG